MGFAKNLLIFAAAALAAALTTFIAVSVYEYTNMEFEEQPDFADPPPVPRFLSTDTMECKYVIEQHY